MGYAITDDLKLWVMLLNATVQILQFVLRRHVQRVGVHVRERIWPVFAQCPCMCVLCARGAIAHELYIHIQMLPSSSKALITNSQCLR